MSNHTIVLTDEELELLHDALDMLSNETASHTVAKNCAALSGKLYDAVDTDSAGGEDRAGWVT